LSRPVAAGIAVGVAAAILAACTSSARPSHPPSATAAAAAAPGTTATIPAATAASLPPPAGLPAFYAVPGALPAAGPGSLIRSEPVAVAGLHGTAFRVMYVSDTVDHHPVAVTGTVAVPVGPAPAGGFPVVTLAHGTDGMAPQCAESLDPSRGQLPVALLNDLLDRGWELTASDYQGEGTPGPLPYLVGAAAAQDTIDIVRAAGHLPGAQASRTYAVWGHSEGGQTALFDLELAPGYAPDLHLVGVVAGAAPSQFGLIYQFLRASPFRYYLLMVAGGYRAAYGPQAAPVDQILTPLGVSLLGDLTRGCDDYLQRTLDAYPFDQVATVDPFSVPAWRQLLTANDPASFSTASPVPLLMPQGGSDEQIPTASTQLLAQHLCGLGQDLERWIYPGLSHYGAVAVYLPDMIEWLADRFAGRASPDPMTPTGEKGVETTTCPPSTATRATS
jgi:hypothetical protein